MLLRQGEQKVYIIVKRPIRFALLRLGQGFLRGKTGYGTVPIRGGFGIAQKSVCPFAYFRTLQKMREKIQ